MDDKAKSWKKKLHQLVRPDWVFGFMLVASIIIFIVSGPELQIGGGVVVSPAVKAILVFSLLAAICLLVTVGISFDRKLADDYFFQLMAQGAIVAIVSTLVSVGTFALFKDWLPILSVRDIFSVMMAGWSLGYFFYRWKGLNP
jgi:uncharacterized membrane protein